MKANKDGINDPKKIFFVQIISGCWISTIPVSSGLNQSYGPVSILEFYVALKWVKKGTVESELEKWIFQSGFFRHYPLELVLGHDMEAFKRILSAYAKDCELFFEQNEKFYLWIQHK